MTKVLQEAQVCLNRTHEHKLVLIISIYYIEKGNEEPRVFDKFYTLEWNVRNIYFVTCLPLFITVNPPRLHPNDVLHRIIFFLKLEVRHILLVVLAVRKCIPGKILSNWVNLSCYTKQKGPNEPFSLLLDHSDPAVIQFEDVFWQC